MSAFELSVWDATSVDDLDDLGPDYDAAVLATSGVAQFCSSRDWAIAAAEHLHPGREPLVVHRDGSWLALTHGHHPQVGPYLQPLEGDWGFCAPLLGPDQTRNIALLSEALQRWEDRWQVALLHGLDRATATAAAKALGRYRVVVRDGIQCRIASIEGGVDGFLSRRSARFRRNLRRDVRRCQDRGIRTEVLKSVDSVPALMKRILAVETRSWKTVLGQSVLASHRYRAFYTEVLERAQRRGALRAAFVSLEDNDLAYVFGAVLEAGYRGFQLGFDTTWSGHGPGNVAQMAMIESLCSEGITSYDLGMEMPYKARWAEQLLPLQSLVVVNPR